MPNTLNSHVPTQAQVKEVREEKLAEPISQTQVNNQQATSDDWSDATKELLDALPQVWTRGLLYFLVVFLGIILPWAMLSKVDETGIAQGRLEPNSKTFKLDAAVTGTIAKLNVKAGEKVEAGQSLVELESELVSNEIEQVKDKLEGQKNRLQQLNLIKSQLEIALSTQQQQNQAQELEKQTQVEQVRQQVVSLQNSYRLQQEEKEAQLNQAREALSHSQKAYQLAESRLANSQTLVQRYRTAFEQGIVAEIEVMGREDLAQEKQRILEQSQSDLEQAKLRLEEQESSYQRNIKQVQDEIKQAQLRLEEQQRSLKSLVHAGKLAILKSQEQLKNLETQITTLKSEIEQSESQIASLQLQLKQRVVESPISGTVFQLPVQGKGEVVQPGEMIAEIAPEGSSLVLQAQMATTESGSLQEGMAVKIKFDAYPFQDYGVIEGKLKEISPTSKVKETVQGQVATYDLEIELDQDCIPKSSKCIPLRPGDTATAEVIVRQRRLIDFILDPFKKLQEGGIEL